MLFQLYIFYILIIFIIWAYKKLEKIYQCPEYYGIFKIILFTKIEDTLL